MQLSKKQGEYICEAHSRWNIKSGAVRSGKTFGDTAYVIPARIRERHGKSGLAVILGVSRDTIERNVLQPMRELYTADLVGQINSRNMARIFGEDVYCLGAEKISQVAKIQGSSIKYAYGDEVAKWNQEVFQMLKSRMDKPYSCFDGSCNPENPTHWLKEFMDSDIDIYLQHYKIHDNPFIPKDFIDNLCKEYRGTIYYDRLIEGEWKRAEGAIYRKYADNPKAFKIDILEKEPEEPVEYTYVLKKGLLNITVGLDFGGNKSGHSLVARAYDNKGNVIILKSRRYMNKDYPKGIDANVLEQIVVSFVGAIEQEYGEVECLYWDNAETTLGQSVRNAVEKSFNTSVRPARKKRIKDRIDCVVRLMGAGRFFITPDCDTLDKALQEAVYDTKKQQDERLDDGSSDVDTLDAFEYTIERDIRALLEDF